MFEYILYDMMRTPAPSKADVRGQVESAVTPIESRLDHLELACAGLWKLLKDKHGYSDEELVAAIQEVDGRDGQLDGKIAHVSQVCPHCQRKLLSRTPMVCSCRGGS